MNGLDQASVIDSNKRINIKSLEEKKVEKDLVYHLLKRKNKSKTAGVETHG